MSLEIITKTPIDVLDYDFDFSRWLPADDRIATATASVSGSPSLTVNRVDFADRSVRVWLAGGASGDAATLIVIITTLAGRTKEVSAAVRIGECA